MYYVGVSLENSGHFEMGGGGGGGGLANADVIRGGGRSMLTVILTGGEGEILLTLYVNAS